jgi:two-component system sensor histidine kinase MprB
MSLRAKLALILASLAALAAIGVGVFSYEATSGRMLAEIDSTLKQTRERYEDVPDSGGFSPKPGGAGPQFGIEQQFVVQVLDGSGQALGGFGLNDDVALPVSEDDRDIAQTGRGENLRTVAAGGREYRVLTRSVQSRGGGITVAAIQFGRDLSEMNRVLSDLRARILLVGGIAVALAAIAGWLFARSLTKSLRALTVAAGEVSTTGRLDIDVSSNGRDEVGRLGTAFATMLAALSRSREEQRRLVQDAGHELRTPLTSLRTNVDVLRRHHDLPADMRAKVLDDLDVEVGELSSLVEEVVAVGSGRTSDEPSRPVQLAAVVDAAAERVGRRTGRTIDVHTDAAVVVAQRSLLERAITNLLDNAAKFDRTDRPIVISAVQGRVAVRDHGPGIAPDDLSHVFDRFFRSVDARSQPGSGLGLSIVTEVAAAHGGSTFAENHVEGGAVVGFQLPVSAGTAG